MNTLGNLIWFIFGGLYSAIIYAIGGLLLCLTVIGIPFGIQCFKLAGFVLWPFGKLAVSTPSSAGCLTLLLNIIWILSAGLSLAIGHIIWGLILMITIVGIPFGRQHFKLVELSLMPFGKKIVNQE